MKKTNIKKAVTIYVDFDDTLYLHEVHWKYHEDFEYNMFFGFGKLKYSEKYLNHELLNKVKSIKAYYEARGIKCFINLLTGCKTSVYFKAKTNFLDKAEPNTFDNYFSVSTQEEKVSMIWYYNHELEKEYDIIKTIVIDDGYGVTAECQDSGYDAITPGFFEKHYVIEERDEKG